MEQPTNTDLTVQLAAHLRTIVVQLDKLRDEPIATQHGDAQIKALYEELLTSITPHFGELLEAFMLVKHEYEPLIQGEAIKLRRAQEVNAALMARRFQAQQVQKAKDDIVAAAAANTAPGVPVQPADNIIVLEQPKN